MKWLWKPVLLLLLAVWGPITVHCNLELVPGLAFMACSDHSTPHQASDCEQDGCATIESGAYRIEDNPPLVAAPLVLLVPLSLKKPIAEVPSEPPLSQISTAPPELSPGWQFLCRAAPPSRAPAALS